jgi:transcriptional regulator with XRE-family HTH domain
VEPEEDAFVETVGRRVGELRTAAKKSQAEVAEALSMTLTNYQRIEHGQQNLTLRSLFRIASVLGVEVKEFFTPCELPKPKRGRPRTT